jgi:cytochrome c biogenesis protein
VISLPVAREMLEHREQHPFNDVVWNIFSSLKLTIFLLIFLAATSVVGTIVLQNGTPQQYLAEYGPRLSRVLAFFGLFDMYHSWWFTAVLALLVINVVFCSLKRLPSVWRQIFRSNVDLSPSRIEAQPFKATFRGTEETDSSEAPIEREVPGFFGKPRRIERSDGLLLYFEKGRYGRLGVYIAHFSLIIILGGGLIGSLFGFKGLVTIKEGQTVDTILLRQNGGAVPHRLDYQVRCDDFDIAYYDTPGPQKFVSEYTSTLSILEDGETVRQERVRVNHPMIHRGIRFYQTSYGNEAEIVLRVTGREGGTPEKLRLTRGMRVKVPETDLAVQLLRYHPEVHTFGEGVQLLLFPKDQPPRRIWLFKDIPEYDEKRGGRFVLTLQDIILTEFTVLQVAREPGVWVVWIGSALLIIGTFMAFFVAHCRLWVHISGEGEKHGTVVVGGNAHRNKVSFEREFGELTRRLENLGLEAR